MLVEEAISCKNNSSKKKKKKKIEVKPGGKFQHNETSSNILIRQKFYICNLNFVDDCFQQKFVEIHNFACLILDLTLCKKGEDP